MKNGGQAKLLPNRRLLFLTLVLNGLLVANLYAAGGADASNPTAAVNYSDLRYQSFDLGDTGGGDDRDRFALEGAYVLTPAHKFTYELNYWDTDITGRDESGFESLKIRYINLTPGQLSGGLKYKLALGAELITDLGDTDDGIGSGTDQIAPLLGAGWLLDDRNFVITLVQYFHSYDEDDNTQQVRTTGPRLIWIHKLPQYNAWFKLDDKFSIDHENDDHSSNIVELQLGKMLTPGFGIYVDYLNNTGGTQQYDDGVGIGFRFTY
jgi:hypothetical protein